MYISINLIPLFGAEGLILFQCRYPHRFIKHFPIKDLD